MPLPRSLSCRRPRDAARSARKGSWKNPTYQDLLSWPGDRRLVTKAAGWGTETDVSERTAGCRAATSQATAAPQSWPTTCTSRPTESISAHTSATSSSIR